MAPNQGKSEVFENDNNRDSGIKETLEVLYDGFYYDVTDFVNRHPGGNVIKFYTQKGEDATEAIQQFHNRSISKIQLMMKSFKRRPATDADCFTLHAEVDHCSLSRYGNLPFFGNILDIMDSAQLQRHRSMTHDFVNLFVEIQKEGLFEPSYWRIALRLAEPILFWALGLALYQFPSILLKIIAYCCIGVGSGRAGWLMHEGGHNSLTGIVKIDKFIQSAYMGLFLGLSGGWWNRGHNKHHAMPQRMNHDVDLNTMPFLAYNAKVVKDPKEGKTFFIQNQTWMFLSADCFLGYLAWAVYICPRNAWKRGDYLDLFMMAVHWVVVYQLICYFNSNPLALLFVFWVGANYMFGNFALSHTHLPITEEHTHWVEYGLIHTANIDSSILVDWWMGYLNFQIEHHLFPTLPQFRSYLVQDRVKALAKKYNIPYHSYSYGEGWAKTLKNFSDVAKEFR